jgi:mono/diheme cytochrome c family protein
MKHQTTVLVRRGVITALVLSLCGGAARAQQPPAGTANAALDRMIAAGKSQREVAQYIFDTRGCNGCHTIGRAGKLDLTKKGQETAQGFEGCISTLKAMTIIAKVPEERRSDTQRRRTQRFEAFGCATCHMVTPGKVALTEMGTKLANLHLGCVDVEKVLAGSPASQR